LTAAPQASSALMPTANTVAGSFRILSASERRNLKPLRVRVVTVQPGETAGSLAARMSGLGRALEMFRLLNAMPPGAGISAGDRVKIVTDR
ncbi:MAG: metalloprotease, partial [Nitratireductor sp.]